MKRCPQWLLYAFLSFFWWGVFGFLSKMGSDRSSVAQMQILFTVGVLPLVFVCLVRLHFRIATHKLGVMYAVLMGVFSALGSLAFFAALKNGKASLVGPIISLYPALTVVLALLVLKERVNRTQVAGLILAMASVIILSI